MKIDKQLTDEVLLGEVGARLAALRLERNLTQGELAEQAGVSKRTIERLESGAVAAQLSVLLRVSRVLGLLDGLEAWLPEVKPGPMQQLQAAAKDGRRRRATGRRGKADGGDEPEPKPWAWGDEA